MGNSITKLSTFEKVRKVILSCETVEHLHGADKMIRSFRELYEDNGDDEYSRELYHLRHRKYDNISQSYNMENILSGSEITGVARHYENIIVLTKEDEKIACYYISEKNIAKILSTTNFEKRKKRTRIWLEPIH